MKHLFYILVLMPFILSAEQPTRTYWSSVLDSILPKMVLIEYYEGISSLESIQARERIKKQLTGFVVNPNGLIITSSKIFRANLEFSGSARFFMHPQKPMHIRVKFKGQEYRAAEFVGKDEDSGLAFIRPKNKRHYPFLKFSKEQNLTLGSKILFLQHLPKSFDFQPVLRERQINAQLKKPHPVFLCDENSTSSLSSFGLVLNEAGDPVGLLQPNRDAGEFSSARNNNLARFVLFNQFEKLIANPPVFKEKETSRKKWLGIYSQPFTRELAGYFKQKNLKGVLISTVIDDSPAHKAGLKSGDVIVSLDGKPLVAEKGSDLETFRQLIRKKTVAQLDLRIFRQGKYLEKKVLLGETPISQFLAGEASSSQLGFSAKELTQDIILAKQLNFDTQGVWVSRVERAGWADVAGLRIGDLILKMNDKTLNSLQTIKNQFTKIDKEKPEYVSLFIKRQSDTEFLFVKTNY